jgi:exonuclease SbcD
MLTLLHTADWHLGHSLQGVSRHLEHQQFLQFLLEQLLLRRVDALIVAGDIFDSANPSAQAQTQLYDFLVQAKQQQPQLSIILIGGNHDSASRLEAPAALLNTLGVHVIGGLSRLNGEVLWDKLLIPLTNSAGDTEAWCGAMPFLRNADLPNNNDNEQPLIAGVSSLYAELFAQLQQKACNGEKLLLTGHCYMVGGQISELSERKILGGNQHALPVDLFPEAIDYVALGHLHNPQAVAGKNHIRYSGSPIPLSFDESDYRHQVLQIELSKQQPISISSIIIPRSIDLIRIPNGHDYGKLSDVLVQLHDIAQDYQQVDEARRPFVELRILLDKPVPNLHQQIDAVLAELPVRVLKRSLATTGTSQSLADISVEERLEELQPLAVFERCYHNEYQSLPPAELNALFIQLLEQVQTSA